MSRASLPLCLSACRIPGIKLAWEAIKLHPVDLIVMALHAFAIQVLNFDMIQAFCKRKDGLEETTEGRIETAPRQLEVRSIHEDMLSSLLTEHLAKVGVKKILPNEMPRKGRNDLHLARDIDQLQAVDQAFLQRL